MNRRDIIKSSMIASLSLLPSKRFSSIKNSNSVKGKVKHSVCRWCYNEIPLEKFIDDVKEVGLQSIELLSLSEIKSVQKKGLDCAIANGSSLGITKGFNNKENHAKLIADYNYLIPRLADCGVTQVICFSGNKNGMNSQTGLDNCAIGLEKVLKTAYRYNVKVVMELLNSKVDHLDYQCDNTPWGVALIEKIGHEQFKLLYDIYHMQIMEGNVIDTIKSNHQHISHYHTGGVPGRNEINETQELNFKAIIKAIINTGYDGYIAQEFIPTRQNLISSLKEGIEICDI